MLNVDKYREEIAEIISKHIGWTASNAVSHLKPYKTYSEIIDWLFSEYEPPLLKNGDGLKPGDWIMVRHSDAAPWRKKSFLCYCKGIFYASNDNKFLKGNDVYIDVIGYLQARLPEDGE